MQQAINGGGADGQKSLSHLRRHGNLLVSLQGRQKVWHHRYQELSTHPVMPHKKVLPKTE